MPITSFDPLTDPRWPDLLARHSRASVFHSRPWLQALQDTYGYRPLGFTTCGSTLDDSIVFCEVNSWLTGKRLVSLPFSDHCEPLTEPERLPRFLDLLRNVREARRYRYVELRPLSNSAALPPQSPFTPGDSFCFHSVDLRPSLDVVHRRMHESCIRRKIKKAEREKLMYKCGNSPELLDKFGRLMLLTRRRHKLPPQPPGWFQNLAKHFAKNMQIHLASKDGQPAASIVTLRFKQTLVYKYGCSDAQFNSLGATPLLFWKVIEEAKQNGVEDFDLGRSATTDEGLIAFKQHLGGSASSLQYLRNPAPKLSLSSPAENSWVRALIARLPDPLLAGTGQLLYRHLG